MSIKAINWAWSQTGIDSQEQLLLLAIANYYNDEAGKAWPSQEQLTALTKQSICTLTRRTKSLKDKGLLTTSRRAFDGGKLSRYNYYLPLTEITSQADYQSEGLVATGQGDDYEPLTEMGHTPQADDCVPLREITPNTVINTVGNTVVNTASSEATMDDWDDSESEDVGTVAVYHGTHYTVQSTKQYDDEGFELSHTELRAKREQERLAKIEASMRHHKRLDSLNNIMA